MSISEPHRDAFAEQTFDAIVTEISADLEAGEFVDLGEYTHAHPQFSRRLEGLLPTLEGLAELAREERSTPPDVAGNACNIRCGRVLGDYRIVREIGRGGMGVVYEAVEVSLGRRVALKVLPSSAVLEPRRLQRFKNEARAAAFLEHPHIVRVYGVGVTDGIHHLAMQYIDGQTLSTLIADRREHVAAASTTSTRHVDTLSRPSWEFTHAGNSDFFTGVAELGRQAATALEFAHSQGVIHRDIKPSNLMVDHAGQLWVTDFGLATMEINDELTASGELVGTLRYMSPEQASGKSQLVDHRSDIYSLGATLYELITLQPIFSADHRHDLLRRITCDEPRPPRHITAAVPRDLETVVLKAINKEPANRYPSAEDLADDLTRWLENRPIHARRPTLAQRAGKWVRRHRTLVAAVAIAGTFAAGAIVVTSMLVAMHQRTLAETASRAKAEADRSRDETQALADELRQLLYSADVQAAQIAWQDAHVGKAIKLLDRHRPDRGQQDLRGFEWYYLYQQLLPALTVPELRCNLYCLALSPDGQTLAVGGRGGSATLFDVVTKVPRINLGNHTHWTRGVAFSPDGRQLATGSWDRTVKLWDTATGRELQTFAGHTDKVHAVAFSPDGTSVASASRDHSVRLWDVETAQPLAVLEGQRADVLCLDFASHAGHLASGSEDRTVRVWDTRAQTEWKRLEGHEHAVTSVAYSPSDDRLASASRDGTLRFWDAASGAHQRTLRAHTKGIESVDYSPSGTLLVTGGADRTVKLWDGEGTELTTLKGHASTVLAVRFSPDGKSLVSGGSDGRVRFWDQRAMRDRETFPAHTESILSMRFTADGRRLMTASRSPVVKFWDAATGELLHSLSTGSDRLRALAISPDGETLATAHDTEPGHVMLWNIASGEQLGTLDRQSRGARRMAFSPDGTSLATAEHKVLIWDLATRQTRRTLVGDPLVMGLAYFPDGRHLVTSHLNGGAQLWSSDSGQKDTLAAATRGEAYAVAVSPDGSTVALVKHSSVQLWDVPTHRPLATLGGHSGPIFRLAFLPDGETLVTGSWDHTIKFWDLRTHQERFTLDVSIGRICALTVSPQGRMIAAGGDSGQVQVWRATTDDEIMSRTARPENLRREPTTNR